MSHQTYNPRQIWQQACAEFQLQYSPSVYQTWFLNNPLTAIESSGENQLHAVISSPTGFHSINMKKNFDGVIKDMLKKLTGKEVEVEFAVGDPTQYSSPVASERGSSNTRNSISNHQPSPSNTSSNQTISQTASLAWQTNTANHQPTSNPSPRAEDLFSPNTIASTSAQRAINLAQRLGLRTEYTFETFAVSSSNELAHAAALAVSQRPGQAYNPLFLYGGVGVGKTHLMHAIGNNMLKFNPHFRIVYCTGEDFTNDIVTAIQTKKTLQFKTKYRGLNGILIDDIQFIAGKTTVQEEFFHTFNTLVQAGSQIVMTSDRPPQEIKLLEDRLQSRFQAGLMVDIQEPNFELRTAIILIKSKNYQLALTMEQSQLIAQQVSSARQIEGVLLKLRSAVELRQVVLSTDVISQYLDTPETTSTPQRWLIKPQEVIKIVAHHYQLKQLDLKGSSRHKQTALARHLAMWFLKNKVHMAYKEIGRWFNDRDHSTVIHAVRKIDLELVNSPQLQEDFQELSSKIQQVSR